MVNQQAYNQILDSLYHAKTHFSDLAHDRSEKEHHIKWIILSTHHAAETYLRMVLYLVDPTNPILHKITKKGRVWQPSIREVLNELQAITNKLEIADRALLNPIEELTDRRDEIMHRSSPFDRNENVVALSLLYLSRAFRTRFNLESKSIFNQDPPIEKDLFSALTLEQMKEYINFIEQFLPGEFPSHAFKMCVYCEGVTVPFLDCEACFTEQPLAQDGQ